MTTAPFFAIVIINYVVLCNAQTDSEVQYYVQLINENLQRYTVERGPTDARSYKPKSNKVCEFGKFDYIIIGGGTAGSVIASRLSENKNYKILLIEAGGKEDDFTEIPGYSTYLINSQYGWNFQTTSQQNGCLGMVNNQCTYFGGRGLGGSTILNYLNYIRGNRRNFDDWERQGNPGWSYNDVLPLFLKSENASFNYTDSRYHRRGGYLNVEYESPHQPQYYSFLKANMELGQNIIDPNGRSQIGVAETPFNAIRGRRVSTNRAFLRPAYNRTNLKIMTYSYAVKINIDEFTKEAYGVTFSHNKKLYLARARREIILSAGSFHSPQLLMLSGVGPVEELKNHGIPLIHRLAVGSNLQDHYSLFNLIFTSNVTSTDVSLEQQVRNYLQGFGDLTYQLNSEGMSWYQTRLQNRPDFPDIEIVYFNIGAGVSPEVLQLYYNYNNETFNTLFSMTNPSNTFAIVPANLQPRSRGTVKLNSSSPYAAPLIDPNVFGVQHDLETMYQGIRRVFDLINTRAFRRINATLLPNLIHPQCRAIEFNTREYWYCQIRYLSIPFYHSVGTCAMGPDPTRGAVVDHKLKVHGIKNLRVADASIMPTIINGHTAAPVIMIGEKVSELILNDL